MRKIIPGMQKDLLRVSFNNEIETQMYTQFHSIQSTKLLIICCIQKNIEFTDLLNCLLFETEKILKCLQ